jgi:hypothetical protein
MDFYWWKFDTRDVRCGRRGRADQASVDEGGVLPWRTEEFCPVDALVPADTNVHGRA